MIVAVIVGALAGWLNLYVRGKIKDRTVGTLLSFTAPFVASIPAEMLHASGLVAAVVAGLATSYLGPRMLPPQHRFSDGQNWASVQLILEGLVFVTMGLQLPDFVGDVRLDHTSVRVSLAIAALALFITLAVRAIYVLPLVIKLRKDAARNKRARPKLAELHDRLDNVASTDDYRAKGAISGAQRRFSSNRRVRVTGAELRRSIKAGHPPENVFSAQQISRYTRRLGRFLADTEYLRRHPLGKRETVILVWAGMRGAVTVATAQTLPLDTPMRPLVVLIAFLVAIVSLMAQGLTVAPLGKRMYRDLPVPDADELAAEAEESREQIEEVFNSAAEDIGDTDEISVIKAQRMALLDASNTLPIDVDELRAALMRLDARQIELEMLEK